MCNLVHNEIVHLEHVIRVFGFHVQSNKGSPATFPKTVENLRRMGRLILFAEDYRLNQLIPDERVQRALVLLNGSFRSVIETRLVVPTNIDDSSMEAFHHEVAGEIDQICLEIRTILAEES